MNRLRSLVLTLCFCAIASPLVAQTRYMRVYYIQWVPQGSSSTYGDCQYYEFPGEDGIFGTTDDRNLLIDGGRSSYVYNVLIPFLDQKIGRGGTLWFMALSHDHIDHHGGLWDVLDQYQVKYYYENSSWPSESLRTKLNAEGCGPGSPPGRYFTVTPGVYLSGPNCNVGPGFDPYIEDRILAACTNTDDANDASVIHQIKCGESVFLSGGDSYGNGGESGILNANIYYSYSGAADELALTDIYKVHHHGSGSASYSSFLNKMKASYAVVQVAYDTSGSHDHPAIDSLARIWTSGAIVYRNDLDGTVKFKCDDLGNYDITRERIYAGSGGSGALQYPPPDIPQNLQVASSLPGSVTLDWSDVSGAYGYDVFRSTTHNGDPGAGTDANPGCDATGIYQKINASNVAVSTYTDTTVVPGTTYYYRVSSKKTYAESGYTVCYERRYSNEVASNNDPTATPTRTPTLTPTPTPTSTPPSPIFTHTPAPTETATPVPPPNGRCADAICVADGDVITGSTLGAPGSNDTLCFSRSLFAVWYQYIPAKSGPVTVSLCGSSFDTTLAVFDQCEGEEIACNDDACERQSELVLQAAAGAAYLIRVAGFNTAAGEFVLSVSGGEGSCTVPPPPEPSPEALALNVNSTQLMSGSPLTVDLTIQSVGSASDAYALVLGPSVFSMVLGKPHMIVPGIRPLVTRFTLGQPYSGRLLDIASIPPARGTYSILFGLTRSGVKPRKLADFYIWRMVEIVIHE